MPFGVAEEQARFELERTKEKKTANCHMKCPVCREHVERVKHIATVEVRPAGNHGGRYGMIYMHVGKDRIGKKYRVILEEIS